MSWTRPTLEQIYNRVKADMESRVTADLKLPRVSLLGIMNIVFSGSVHTTYGFLEWLSKQLFVDTASTFGLTRWGNILNLPRKEALIADGTVAFTGTAGKNVVAGTIFVNEEGYEYFTGADFLIGTDVSVAARAVEEGTVYNTEEAYFSLSAPDDDIDALVERVSGFDNGTDLETVESWVLRLLQRFQNPPGSGNPGDYVRWALEVPGVGLAWCYPAEEWGGAGTVGLGVATSELEPVTAGVLAATETYVDSVKPVPAAVTYFTINTLPTVFYISVTPNTPAMREAINTNLALQFTLESKPGGTILLSHMRSAIAAAGPDDYEITQIYLDGAAHGVANITTVVPDAAKFTDAIYTDL
jgi:uncharacterized phage protein gp47/JayE